MKRIIVRVLPSLDAAGMPNIPSRKFAPGDAIEEDGVPVPTSIPLTDPVYNTDEVILSMSS